MAKFKIKWKSGVEEEIEQSDCETVEQYINCRFGRGFDVKEHDCVVTLVGDKVPVHEEVKPKPAMAAKPTLKK